MPINAPVEYYKAEEAYLSAKTREEKIRCLEEMIKLLPKHKSSEHLLGQLKRRLAKLKARKEVRKGARPSFVVRKEGVGQVCLLGLTNSGKSTLLKELTGVNVEIASYPYTTKKPAVGMMRFEDVWIQIVEIPSTFSSESMSIVYGTDLIILVIDGKKHMGKQKEKLSKTLEERRISKKILYVATKKPIDMGKIKKKIWDNLGIIRVYTKTQKKKPEIKPIILPEGSTVEDVTKEVHKKFLDHFRFAKVWGKSVKFGGTKVGLEHILADKDVVRIFC